MAKGSTKVTISLEGANSAVFTVESDYLKFGRYRQTGDGDNVEEWDPQPIEWQILSIDTENKRVLLLSRYGLDAMFFVRQDGSNYWGNSVVCDWLNGDFYGTAFDETEKAKIKATELSDVNFNGRTYDGDTCNVFLLSTSEADTYFADDEARKCLATAYAKKNYPDVYEGNAYGYWWLRSPFTRIRGYVYSVSSLGSIGEFPAFGFSILVRPALWIEL